MTKHNLNLYWGILHCHVHGEYSHKQSKFSAPDLKAMSAQVDSLYDFVIKDRKFDFTVYADHHNMGQMISLGYADNSPWKIVSDKADHYNCDGTFAALKGYEFQDTNDYNVFLCDTKKLPLAPTWKELLKQVKPNEPGVILAAHNRPCPTTWDFSCHPNFRLVELMNDGGKPFEGWVNSGLEKGHKAGFFGGSDDHSCRPGINSCTGVWARSRSREDIWDGLWNRRTIAAMGIRPEIMLTVGDGITMGSDVTEPVDRIFTIFHRFKTAPLLVVLVKNGSLFWQKNAAGKEFSETVEDKINTTSGRAVDYYYAKIYYPDGRMAYTSPIWIKNAGQSSGKVAAIKKKTVFQPKVIGKVVKIRNIGKQIGYHRFINAADLMQQRPDLTISQSARDMVVHVGPDALLATKDNTLIAPTMTGIFEFALNGRKQQLRSFRKKDYYLLLTSLVELNDTILAAGYEGCRHFLKAIKGRRVLGSNKIMPLQPFLYEHRYITPQFLASDGAFLYLLMERELVVMMPNGQIIGTCQQQYPSFPCGVAVSSLSHIYVLSCDAQLTAYDLSTSQTAKIKWTVDLPESCCSVCCAGDEIWVYNNEKIEKAVQRENTKIYVYAESGELKGSFQPDVENIKGTSIAPMQDGKFAAIHNPNREACANYRDQLNSPAMLRIFNLEKVNS